MLLVLSEITAYKHIFNVGLVYFSYIISNSTQLDSKLLFLNLLIFDVNCSDLFDPYNVK